MARDGHACPTWGVGNSETSEIRAGEIAVERAVSTFIGAMPFLWIGIDDEPVAESLRGFIERNTIALLSNYGKQPIDAPSAGWLGHYCDRKKVRTSGLWNSNHVDEAHDPNFLDCLEEQLLSMERSV
jgi:hypothetical protein